MTDCIFCKIINGEIPSAKVYEDEEVYAFLDISQVTKGHTLVIPKQHTKNIYETHPQVASNVFARIPKIATAVKSAFDADGVNIVNNNDEAAYQSVFHLHIHVLPRYENGDGFGVKWTDNSNSYTPEQLQELSQTIAEKIS
ncbi:HIT family protein [Salimicrobium jeotgali]|uniref:HIT family protein n=2 Tax=Salimicrobium TaxID=351195 RepID=K2FL56_9BACI|nr:MULTISPECIES: HIT family protein [Salimicrobium]AKG05009.1 HIT family protein [Salimicrobium jeotgali]EKE31696.1 Hit-like protein involved in cell-cycle regulation [Salimicrobium jeotgali]MBM7696518.1 histidine triad (HIT) family protein [Salimicrobium jeotgali]SIS44622.1 histidine triad (HIT) family protein [Salimicrobium salexigens]